MEISSRKNAILKGHKRYYSGMACKNGHVTERYASNNICVDCLEKKPRVRKGSEKDAEQRADKARIKLVKAVESSEVLDLWAQPGSDLPAKVENYVWTDEARFRLINLYIDTGDLAGARDRIGATPSQYYRELENNPLFSDQIKAASVKAFQALEEKGINMALGGNDKLLTLVLKAKLPGYHEKVQIDSTTTVRAVSDEQLNRKLEALLTRYHDSAILDAEFSEHVPPGTRELAGPSGGVGPANDAEQVSEPVSEDWLTL